jgi:hypothetical protein
MPIATNRAECRQVGNHCFDVTILGQWTEEFREYASRCGHGDGVIGGDDNVAVIRYEVVKDVDAFKMFCKRWHPMEGSRRESN